MISLLGLVGLVLVGLGAGFGLGRIKSAKTVAAIEAELKKVETSAVAEVKDLVAAIRKHL